LGVIRPLTGLSFGIRMHSLVLPLLLHVGWFLLGIGGHVLRNICEFAMLTQTVSGISTCRLGDVSLVSTSTPRIVSVFEGLALL